jgi:hypothetical protein
LWPSACGRSCLCRRCRADRVADHGLGAPETDESGSISCAERAAPFLQSGQTMGGSRACS